LIGGLSGDKKDKKENESAAQGTPSPVVADKDKEEKDAIEMFDGGLKKLKAVHGNKNAIIDDSDENGEDDPIPQGQKTTAAGLPDIHQGRNANLESNVPAR